MTDTKKVQHTPGPYEIHRYTTRGEFVTETCIRSEDGSYLAKIGPCNIDANAVLFAAAPDMFKKLKELVRLMNIAFEAEENPFGIHHNDATDALSAAEVEIAKIEGGL